MIVFLTLGACTRIMVVVVSVTALAATHTSFIRVVRLFMAFSTHCVISLKTLCSKVMAMFADYLFLLHFSAWQIDFLFASK